MKCNSETLGFLVHTPEMIHHYGPVWRCLDPAEFEILAAGPQEERRQVAAWAQAAGLRCRDLDVLLAEGGRYAHLVSNHPLEQHDGRPLIEAVGERHIRFMYALGKARHNFAAWNRLYDLILCFGPYQAERLAAVSGAAKLQMGYPRYDAYFTEDADLDALRKRFGCDPARKTLVWLPTWMELSSIDRYAGRLAILAEQYNLLVKPHPLTVRSESGRVTELQRYPFTQVITGLVDNLLLYRIADWVLCDYGGPAFGALYLDRNLALLNVPGAAHDALTGEDSPDIALRQSLPNFDEADLHDLWDLLEDPAQAAEQAQVRARLRERFFAPYYGFSARVAALALRNRHRLLDVHGAAQGRAA